MASNKAKTVQEETWFLNALFSVHTFKTYWSGRINRRLKLFGTYLFLVDADATHCSLSEYGCVFFFINITESADEKKDLKSFLVVLKLFTFSAISGKK